MINQFEKKATPGHVGRPEQLRISSFPVLQITKSNNQVQQMQ